jgi:hypothetical protein
LPPLPRQLRTLEVAIGERLNYAEPDYTKARSPLPPEALDGPVVGRLLARAEVRYHRAELSARHLTRDWFWLAAELALILPRVHPKVVARWAERLHYDIQRAERELDQLRTIQAAIRAHEPDTERWLRRRLDGLRDSAR